MIRLSRTGCGKQELSGTITTGTIADPDLREPVDLAVTALAGMCRRWCSGLARRPASTSSDQETTAHISRQNVQRAGRRHRFENQPSPTPIPAFRPQADASAFLRGWCMPRYR
jgi:hypothetical protein